MSKERVRVKICGLRTREDIEIINEVKPDYCGFIVEYPKSFRSISRDTLRELVRYVSPEVKPVGVFVNAPTELVLSLLNEGVIAAAQLHGREDESYIQSLKEQTDKPLIKAFVIRQREDAQEALQSSADLILLDQGKGTGKTFDWDLIPPISRPYFLAGGLSAENLSDAVRRLHPWGVDLSSSLETDRRKDPEKIRKVMEILRAIPQETGKEKENV